MAGNGGSPTTRPNNLDWDDRALNVGVEEDVSAPHRTGGRHRLLVPLAFASAVVSCTYLFNVIRVMAVHGDPWTSLVSLVLRDVWANIAITILLLFTGAAGRGADLLLRSIADALRPARVNTAWWMPLFIERSIKYVKALITGVLVWNLWNQWFSLIPIGMTVIQADATDHVNTLLTTVFDANHDGVVTTTEVQMWFVTTSLRLLRFFCFFQISQWLLALKAVPTPNELQSAFLYDRSDQVSQGLRRFYIGLRADRRVPWEQQARSALIDKTLSAATYLSATYWCLSALGVNMTGVLAVGGVSGLAIGFAAQKLVSNCIGGILIFVTQPFVEGDHVAFGSIEGRVEMVGWHSTRISSIEDGFSFIVPNTDVLGSALRNLSRREYSPIKIRIPYPEVLQTRDAMIGFMDEIRRLVGQVVDEYSVRAPSIQMEFDENASLLPNISIKAFINGSCDKNKVRELRTLLMLGIRERLENVKNAPTGREIDSK